MNGDTILAEGFRTAAGMKLTIRRQEMGGVDEA